MTATSSTNQFKYIEIPKLIKGNEATLAPKVKAIEANVKDTVEVFTDFIDELIDTQVQLGKINDKQAKKIRKDKGFRESAEQVAQNIAMSKIHLQEEATKLGTNNIEPMYTKITEAQSKQFIQEINDKLTTHGVNLKISTHQNINLAKKARAKLVPPSPQQTTNEPTIDLEKEFNDISELKDALENIFNQSPETINQSLALISDSEIKDVEQKRLQLISVLKSPDESTVDAKTLAAVKDELSKANDFFQGIENLPIQDQISMLQDFKKAEPEAAKAFQAILYNHEKLGYDVEINQNTDLLLSKTEDQNKTKTELKLLSTELNDINHNVSGIGKRESKINLGKVLQAYNQDLKNSSKPADIEVARNKFIENLEASNDINTSDIKDLVSTIYAPALNTVDKAEKSSSADGKNNGKNFLNEEQMKKAVKVGVPAIGGAVLLAMFCPPAQKLLGVAMSSLGGLTNLGITIFREISDHQERQLRLKNDLERDKMLLNKDGTTASSTA